MPTEEFSGLEIKRYTPALGAEIRGIDLNKLASDPAACDAVYVALTWA